jgi:ParB family chromosome partitioning protein
MVHEARISRLREQDEFNDDEAERLDVLDAEIETLREHTYIWSDQQKARAGAIVTVHRDGKLTVLRGLIHPEDVKAKPAEEEAAPDETGQMRSGFSSALVSDLTAHRTAALRALWADRHEVALAALAHAFVLLVFYMGGDSAFALHVVVPALRAEGIEDGKAAKHSAGQHAAWQSLLPEDEAGLWDWLLAQNAETITGLMAYCAACTIKPVRGAESDQLATALSLDMAQWWQPTVTGYLGRVPKPLILEAVTQGRGAAAAANIAILKKGDMAARAAELLGGPAGFRQCCRPHRRTAQAIRLRCPKPGSGCIYAQKHQCTNKGRRRVCRIQKFMNLGA